MRETVWPTAVVGMVSTFPPRRCGLASYAADLVVGLGESAPDLPIRVIAVDRAGSVYGDDMFTVIEQDTLGSYRQAGVRLAAARVVLIQHEYGIFGGPDGAHVLAFTDELRAAAYRTC